MLDRSNLASPMVGLPESPSRNIIPSLVRIVTPHYEHTNVSEQAGTDVSVPRISIISKWRREVLSQLTLKVACPSSQRTP